MPTKMTRMHDATLTTEDHDDLVAAQDALGEGDDDLAADLELSDAPPPGLDYDVLAVGRVLTAIESARASGLLTAERRIEFDRKLAELLARDPDQLARCRAQYLVG